MSDSNKQDSSTDAGGQGTQEPLTATTSSSTEERPLNRRSREFHFTHCNECQEKDPNYVGCNHPEEDSLEFSHDLANPVPEIIQTTLEGDFEWFARPEPLLKAYEMIRSAALHKIFKSNVDDRAKEIFVSTTAGTILSTSLTVDASITRRASALGCLTWRVNHAISTGGDVKAVRYVSPLETVSTSVFSDEDDEDATGLKKQIVLLEDGRPIAMQWVKEGVVVGAIGPAKEEINPSEGKTATPEGSSEEAAITGEVHGESASEEGKSETAEPSKAVAGEKRQKERQYDVKADQRLLELKVEAMAEFLQKELREFEVPAGV